MSFHEFVDALKLLKLHDTTLALVFFGLAMLYIGSRLQKKVDSFASKPDLTKHKEAVYKEILMVKEDVRIDMTGFHTALRDHEGKDDKRFETIDRAWMPQLKTVVDKAHAVQVDIAKIKGALNIKD